MFKKVVVSISLMMVAMLAVACGGAAEPETIKVGAVVPLSGGFAGGGAQVDRGYQYAVDDINADGGVFVEEFGKKIPLELIVLDDESDPNKTVTNLEALNTEHEVVAYLGGFGSGLHAAGSAIAEKNKIPYLGIAFALTTPHEQGLEYLFAPFPKSADLARDIFDMLNAYIPEGERPTRVAIFQMSSDWGIELGNAWREEAAAHGYEVVVYEEYAPGGSDYTDIILKAKEADAQMLLSLPIPPDGITMQRQMAELDWTPEFQYTIRAADVPTWRDLEEVGDYVTIAPGWSNKMDFPGVAELNAKHVEDIGRPADPIVGPGYGVVQILADAIERAGTLDSTEIRNAISATDMTTVVGPVTFNENGTGNVNMAILQHQQGSLELVWPMEFASADLQFPAPPFGDR